MITRSTPPPKFDRRAHDKMLESTRKCTQALIDKGGPNLAALIRPVFRGEFEGIKLGEKPFAFIFARIRRLPARDANSGEGYEVQTWVFDAQIDVGIEITYADFDPATLICELADSRKVKRVFYDRYSKYLGYGDFETLNDVGEAWLS